VKAFNASLFLSANEDDVRAAVSQGLPAGLTLQHVLDDDPNDLELRIAFDFDGVLVDDESERVFQVNRNVDEFHKYEVEHVSVVHRPGPLTDLALKL
jgi:5'-nucleotidase